MLIHELTASECRDVLARTHLGRLGCARHNQPYIVPISFDFDAADTMLYGFATLGQKIEWMRLNPKVCVEVEDIRDQAHWLTVLIFGRFEELDSAADHAALHRAQSLLQQRRYWWQPAAAKVLSGKEHTTPVFYRIRIDTMTGRRTSRPDSGKG